MSFLSKLKNNYIFKCTECGKTIRPGEFMAIIAQTPQKSWYGVTETIIHRFVKDTNGKVYCRTCFDRHYGKENK
jgi:hypothetical protein